MHRHREKDALTLTNPILRKYYETVLAQHMTMTIVRMLVRTNCRSYIMFLDYFCALDLGVRASHLFDKTTNRPEQLRLHQL